VSTTRLRLSLLGGAAALLLAACGDERQDVFTPEGDKARLINDLQVPVFIIAGVVGVGVAVALFLAITSGRRRYKDDVDDPKQLEGNFKLEIGWTIAPAVLLFVIAFFTVGTLFDLDDVEAQAAEIEGMEIVVYGHQWWWSFEYDVDGDGEPDIITANELVIPADTPVTVHVESRDVIHSFWIPSLNGTIDAVPGRTHSIVLEADEPGEYDGQCKEYCGLSHANMKMRVVAVSMNEFRTWIEQQQEPQPMLAEGDPGFAGQELFAARCTSCHQVNGLEDADGNALEVEGNAAVVSRHAPNLTHLMSRETFAGSLFDLYDPETGEINRSQLEAWIQNPVAEKPMYVNPPEGELPRGMPDLGLTEEEIDQMVDYLITLGPVPPSPSGPEPADDGAGS
jgi:cytochrome c oxidase subunit 2